MDRIKTNLKKIFFFFLSIFVCCGAVCRAIRHFFEEFIFAWSDGQTIIFLFELEIIFKLKWLASGLFYWLKFMWFYSIVRTDSIYHRNPTMCSKNQVCEHLWRKPRAHILDTRLIWEQAGKSQGQNVINFMFDLSYLIEMRLV